MRQKKSTFHGMAGFKNGFLKVGEVHKLTKRKKIFGALRTR